jgi:hypothetical protein
MVQEYWTWAYEEKRVKGDTSEEFEMEPEEFDAEVKAFMADAEDEDDFEEVPPGAVVAEA